MPAMQTALLRKVGPSYGTHFLCREGGGSSGMRQRRGIAGFLPIAMEAFDGSWRR
ncbi:hypothetical protein [Paraburkholderia fungorum]|uniref:hypothetical protein n=1 Tax=Paraburkholderia fungorum TaxID=134537 RepID=UPI0014962200|nr:hypothetical protein [Paraburkholderia fungorum]